MALTFNLRGIQDQRDLWNDSGSDLAPVTKALVYGTMFVGMNEITDKNYKEFYARVHIFQTAIEPIMRTSDGAVIITLDNVKRYIGLRTNASPMTKATFLNSVYRNVMDDVERKLIEEGE